MRSLFEHVAPGSVRQGGPLIVDSFAGGGGASTGIEMALGRSPDIAINHDADALAMHIVNHPDTLHLSKNIWHVDPLEAVGHRRVGLAWFSPDCKHFSKAKGGKPVKRNIRDLAWVVVLWAKRVRPEVIILENVEEFREWGPVSADGKPCPERKGQTFKLWMGQLKRLGYKIEWRELRACDYGAPTIRKRFFMIARRDGRPIVWPEPTHGPPDDPDVIAGRKLPWRTAAEIIDWSIPCPSIFDTSEEIKAKFGIRANRPLAEATMRRIARGVVRYVLEAKTPFIVRTDMATAAERNGVHATDEPACTLTTARSFALDAPVIASAQYGGSVRDAQQPLHTLTAKSKVQNAKIVPSFVGCGGRAGQSAPRGGDEPLGTQTAKADGCVVATHLTKFQSGSTGSAAEPEPTVTANSYLKRPGGAAPNGVVAATMVQTGYGEREGQAPRALDVKKPIGTQVAGGAKHGVVAAFLAQHNTDMVGHEARSPVSTIVQKGCTQSVVAAHLTHFYGSNVSASAGDPEEPLTTVTTSGGKGGGHEGVVAAHMMRQFGASVGSAMDDPVGTITAGGAGKAALISGFLTKYYGQGDGAAVTGPMHTDTTKDRFGLVTVEIDGATYAIADLGMRMLTPRERFRAQGFPESYIVDRRPDGSAITGTVQGRCCGNSVCPPLAEALVRANCAHMAVEKAAAE
ncbi:DNA cytosine methyltransferase [Nitratireductor sp. GCM10026969]|uniref:DNA cytosine methyltransferase n=1 Tax=Nitratireductor sp. GCM10026969 TaxID=3252645 RepID=UPI00361E2977